MSGIFVIQEGGGLVPLTESPYDTEALLQSLLAQYPDLLAGSEITPDRPRRWLLVTREAAIPDTENGGGRWAVDHLFLDQDGIPTLVEVKRSCDTRIRREVVGQMLDYAANAVVYWPIEHLQVRFERTCTDRGDDPENALKEFLGPEGGEPERFWQTVKTNLQAGRVRLLFVADVIPEELRRVVEFLNQQMDPAEVLALEVRQYVGPSLRTLVPRLIGRTAEAEQRKSTAGTRPSRQWNEASFFNELIERGLTKEAQVARRLLDWGCKKMSRIWWGKGAVNGSFVPVLEHGGAEHQSFVTYAGGPRGTPVAEISFQWCANKPPFANRDLRLEMLRKLNNIPGVSLPEYSIDRRPSIPLATLAEEDRLEQFLRVMDWYVEQVKQS